jgi:hypothetical protein
MSETDLLAWNEANDYEDEGQGEDYSDVPAETVCATLRDIVARIDGSFEEAAEGRCDVQYALEQARDRLADLVVSAFGHDVLEPILGSEDGCGACGAHWLWTPWASEADKSGRRHQHAAACPVLLGEGSPR